MISYKDIRKKIIRDGDWCCDFSIEQFVDQIESWQRDDNLELNPDFQRGHVWSEENQKQYIEALLEKRVKNANTIYLNHTSWHEGGKGWFVCVDGLQRITAVQKFYNNEISYKQYYLNDFTDKEIVLRMPLLKININTLKTKKEVLKWYLQMNTGGVVHSKEEIKKVQRMLESENS